jgi:hypothetical protein
MRNGCAHAVGQRKRSPIGRMHGVKIAGRRQALIGIAVFIACVLLSARGAEVDLAKFFDDSGLYFHSSFKRWYEQLRS